MNLLIIDEHGEHIYYMVRVKNGLVHSLEVNMAVPYDGKNVRDYAQYPKDIGGGLIMFPEAAYQITIVVYVMRKKGKKNEEDYKPRDGDKVVKIYQ